MTPRPRAVLAYYGYGTLDSPWYTRPSAWYRRAIPLVSERDAFDAVATRVVVDGHQRPDGWKFYIYCRQNGLWPKLVAGLDPATQGSELRAYSPTYHVTAEFPETLLIHGTVDNDVPHAESAALAASFELHGVPHELISVDGADHQLVPTNPPRGLDAIAAAHERAAGFLRRHLARDRLTVLD